MAHPQEGCRTARDRASASSFRASTSTPRRSTTTLRPPWSFSRASILNSAPETQSHLASAKVLGVAFAAKPRPPAHPGRLRPQRPPLPRQGQNVRGRHARRRTCLLITAHELPPQKSQCLQRLDSAAGDSGMIEKVVFITAARRSSRVAAVSASPPSPSSAIRRAKSGSATARPTRCPTPFGRARNTPARAWCP